MAKAAAQPAANEPDQERPPCAGSTAIRRMPPRNRSRRRMFAESLDRLRRSCMNPFLRWEAP